MELNWSTFLLEIINFLILVWILKRFLYKPVLGVIEKRRKGIADTLAHAEALRGEAEVLRQQYESRLADWEAEREKAREVLIGEIDDERRRRMKSLETELEQERERMRVVEERRRGEATRKTERLAMMQAERFASRLLSAVACSEVENRLVDLMMDELAHLPADRLVSLRAAWEKPPEEILVTSCFPLAEDTKRRLEEALTAVAGTVIPFRYEQSEDLVAGLRIVIGAWVLRANLKDELAAFAEFAHDER